MAASTAGRGTRRRQGRVVVVGAGVQCVVAASRGARRGVEELRGTDDIVKWLMAVAMTMPLSDDSIPRRNERKW